MKEYIDALEREGEKLNLGTAFLIVMEQDENNLFKVETSPSDNTAGLAMIGPGTVDERREQFNKIAIGVHKIADLVRREVEREHRNYELKLNSNNLTLLDKYNKFLQEHGYTDSDVDMEEPTAINQFLEEIGEEERIEKEENHTMGPDDSIGFPYKKEDDETN